MTIIKKFDTEKYERKFPKKCVVLTVLGLFALSLIEIWASNTVVAFGDRLEKLSILEKNLKTENQILENKIAKEASLTNIASKSAQLGFSNHQGIQYIR